MAEPKRYSPVPASQPAPGGIAARALGARPTPYLLELNPEQREAVETLDGPVLVLGRRGNGKNASPYNADSPYFESGAGAAKRNLGGDVHQQGRARDEAACWHDGRPNSRGNAVAWYFPLDRREDLEAACRDGRFEVEFHDFGRRRPDPADQNDLRSGEARRSSVACSGVRHDPRRLEEPGINARPGARRRGRGLRQRQGQEALPRLSGAAEDAQRRRLRRPAAGVHPAVQAEPGRAAAVPGALQVHPGGRVSGHQRGAVSVAAAAGAAGGGRWPHPSRRIAARCSSG